jgi:HSP20 family protein
MFWTIDGRGYDPFEAVRNLQKEMNRIFNAYDGRVSGFPPVNIWSGNDQVIVTAEIPGMNPEDIDISVVQGQLTISGERKNDAPEGDVSCHRRERVQGSFSRSFRLPFDVNGDKVTAQYQNGILTVTLPRLEETKPRKITVETK